MANKYDKKLRGNFKLLRSTVGATKNGPYDTANARTTSLLRLSQNLSAF